MRKLALLAILLMGAALTYMGYAVGDSIQMVFFGDRYPYAGVAGAFIALALFIVSTIISFTEAREDNERTE